MSTVNDSINPELESLVRSRVADLLRSNEMLRHKLLQAQEECVDLMRKLQEATTDSKADRAFRRAALNLMEDAENARREAQRETLERRRAEEKLIEANRRKDEFLAILAHELRNPLAPIRNSLEILRLTGPDSGAATRIQEMLDRQVSHMVRLVDDLLEVSRISRGKINLRMERTNLGDIFRGAVEISKPLIEAAGHQLTVEIPDEPIALHADPIRLAQVLANLLNNAAKYTQATGEIWLTARRESTEVAISVRDNGIGIPTDMLPRVFDLFTQVDRTVGRAQGGLGIGLTLVRSLVESHGGTVEARSEGPGLGSEFIVRLPIAAESADSSPQPSSPTPSSESAINDRRILVVDDNRDAAESLGMILRLLGAQVWTAHDGASGLEIMEQVRPTVVFLDIGMPGMDGHEVARRVRRRPEFDDMVLVALTGWGQEEDRRRCKEAGFNHHLTKPVQLQTIQEILGPVQRNGT